MEQLKQLNNAPYYKKKKDQVGRTSEGKVDKESGVMGSERLG